MGNKVGNLVGSSLGYSVGFKLLGHTVLGHAVVGVTDGVADDGSPVDGKQLGASDGYSVIFILGFIEDGNKLGFLEGVSEGAFVLPL